MEQFFDSLSSLEVRLIENILPNSHHQTPTAIFQFGSRGINKFVVRIDIFTRLRFAAFYQHKGKYYPHPYTLQEKFSQSSIIAYEVSIYLHLKRLRDFEHDDLRRYYEAIDNNVDTNTELHDFHNVYLILHYEINGQPGQFPCNKGQPIHLPTFISNPWTQNNTITRFRYDAENRDGILPCEMTLQCGNIVNLSSYKIIICLISNTIPAQMDYHGIRWIYKMKSKVLKQKKSSTRQGDREKAFCLSHESGIVVARVFGPNLKFTPKMLHPINNLNYVRSCFESEDFKTEFQHSNDTGALAVIMIKGTDYPKYMKKRRNDREILRYLPFNELEDVNNNLQTTDVRIVKHFKSNKEQRNSPLILCDDVEQKTYSQAHVRLYVAAYDDNDILLTETLHPPIRNHKIFESLRIIRIVQPKTELQANEQAFVYCAYDYSKSKLENGICPYKFEIVFTRLLETLNNDQLLHLFNKPHLCVNASYVNNCPCLLEFQVPNDPKYHEHRIYIRLLHTQSKDYNPSPIALCDNERWIYYADPISVVDMFLENDDDTDIDPLTTDQTNIELRLQPVCYPLLPLNSEDENNSDQDLHTPEWS